MQRIVRHSEANKWWTRPSRVVLAVSADEEGRADIIALGWKMTTSGQPPMVAISIAPERHSHGIIQRTGEFVLSSPAEDMAKATMFCGTTSGRDTDKFKETGLTAMPASKVKPPLIGEALVNLECVVRGELTTGDHTIFAGEIVASHVSENPSRRLLLSIGHESGYKHLLSQGMYRFGVIRND